MKSLRCEKPLEFVYHDLPIPLIEEGQTLLRIRRVGICGTDIHAFEGTQPYFSYPRILGHELAAQIVETTHPNFSKDEFVTIIPYNSCGECIACRRGKTNCCVSMRVLGVHMDGGMADFLVVPNELLIKSSGLDLDELAMVEPLAISAHAVRRANVSRGDFVLVIGAGPIGLGTVRFAQIAGAEVIVLDLNQDRLDFCKERLHVKFVINPLQEDFLQILNNFTNGNMPTSVFDATGNLRAIEQAFQYMSHGGNYILIGIQKNDIAFSHPEFHKKEATLMSSRNATILDFDYVIQCIHEKLIDPKDFISLRIPFEKLASRFGVFYEPNNKIIKAIVEL